MILAVRQLGYLRDDDLVYDPTYGLGRWWTKYRPAHLTGSDLNPDRSPSDPEGVDFTDNAKLSEHFDVVAFDPPYKLRGGGAATIDSERDLTLDGRFGVEPNIPWQQRHQLIKDGMLECFRVLKPGGYLLLKCQDQVCSGKMRWQTLEFSLYALMRGHELVERLDMLGGRPQPPGRRQVHAHSSYSTLLIFKKRA